VKHNVPIILLRVANAFAGDPSEIDSILSDLPTHLELLNPGAGATLREYGADAATIAATIKPALAKATPLTFDPHESSRVMHAHIQQLAETLVEHACPENSFLLVGLKPVEAEPWPTQRHFAILIVHEQTAAMAHQQAVEIKAWLMRRTELQSSQIEIQGGREREINDAVAADTAVAAEHTDCVLLVQTANVISEPRCLAGLYGAAMNGVPVVPVVLLPSTDDHKRYTYNFETAKSHLEGLPSNLKPGAATALEAATGVPAMVVGGALRTVLPNIISRPLGIGLTQNEVDAQMSEIERSLRQCTR
jgi:hypothetical protein